MDDFRVGRMPAPPLDGGFETNDATGTAGASAARRAEATGGLANPATTLRVEGEAGPASGVGDWLDTPPPGQDFDVTSVMLALHQAGNALRSAMQEARQVARDAQQVSMRAEAQDIRDSAMETFAASLTAGIGQMASGGLDIAGAGVAYRTAFPGGGGTDDLDENDIEMDNLGEPEGGLEEEDASPAVPGYTAPEEAPNKASARGLESDTEIEMDDFSKTQSTGEVEEETEVEDLRKQESRTQQKRQDQDDNRTDAEKMRDYRESDIELKRWTGISQIANSLGQLGAAGFQLQSRQDDAKEKTDEADAAKAASQVEDADNLVKNAEDLMAQVRQVFSQIIEAKNEAMSRVTQM